MSFAEWKKRSKLFRSYPWAFQNDLLTVAQAAYKAGERQGRKDAEAVCRAAIDFLNEPKWKE